MKLEKLTKRQRNELEQEYQSLFGGQISVMKTLFKTNLDSITLDELLESVSSVLYQVMQTKGKSKAEMLIEKMCLSALEYDVLLFCEPEIGEHEANIYFYNHYQVFEYTDIRIKNAYDLKKLIIMIMHVGKQYDHILHYDREAEMDINDYQLLDGIDQDYILEMNNQYQTKKALN
ncbi:MAG: hypothetical protein KKG64_03810 [Firmicutes bacterium]|nr:hypothetical protein [Bacillota bacterium]